MRNLIETSDFTPAVPVVENGDNGTAENFNPAPQALANRTRYLKDAHESLEVVTNGLLAMVKPPSFIISPMNFSAADLGGTFCEWEEYDGLTDSKTTAKSGPTVIGAQSVALDSILPRAVTITAVRALVSQATGLASPMELHLKTMTNRVYAAGSPAVGSFTTVASQPGSGSSGLQVIEITGLSVPCDGRRIVAEVRCSGGTAAQDTFYGLVVQLA